MISTPKCLSSPHQTTIGKSASLRIFVILCVLLPSLFQWSISADNPYQPKDIDLEIKLTKIDLQKKLSTAKLEIATRALTYEHDAGLARHKAVQRARNEVKAEILEERDRLKTLRQLADERELSRAPVKNTEAEK
jgi:hypothetical protein